MSDLRRSAIAYGRPLSTVRYISSRLTASLSLQLPKSSRTSWVRTRQTGLQAAAALCEQQTQPGALQHRSVFEEQSGTPQGLLMRSLRFRNVPAACFKAGAGLGTERLLSPWQGYLTFSPRKAALPGQPDRQHSVASPWVVGWGGGEVYLGASLHSDIQHNPLALTFKHNLRDLDLPTSPDTLLLTSFGPSLTPPLSCSLRRRCPFSLERPSTKRTHRSLSFRLSQKTLACFPLPPLLVVLLKLGL